MKQRINWMLALVWLSVLILGLISVGGVLLIVAGLIQRML